MLGTKATLISTVGNLSFLDHMFNEVRSTSHLVDKMLPSTTARETTETKDLVKIVTTDLVRIVTTDLVRIVTTDLVMIVTTDLV